MGVTHTGAEAMNVTLLSSSSSSSSSCLCFCFGYHAHDLVQSLADQATLCGIYVEFAWWLSERVQVLNIEGLWSQIPLKVCFLELESLNIGYWDPVAFGQRRSEASSHDNLLVLAVGSKNLEQAIGQITHARRACLLGLGSGYPHVSNFLASTVLRTETGPKNARMASRTMGPKYLDTECISFFWNR